ncbi:MAG: hypothetical protein K8T91_04510 [Planctomycetes bacterium]|nr:hypothetical protein [Planctomycetota bacterium]
MPAPTESQNDGNLNSPADDGFVISKSDTEFLAQVPRGIYVGVGGDIKVDLVHSGTALVFKNVASGCILPVRATRVYSTDTTATDMIGLY